LGCASFFENIFMNEQMIVLGTGGTIAGTATSSNDHTGYTAAQLSVDALLSGVPGLQAALKGALLKSEQIAQLDSKDMDFETMLRLAKRCAFHLAQSDVKAVIITHGTDTLEETAYFLHRVIPPELQSKPVVMTCAMRPATSSEADGPRNLRDAVTLASDARARGVLVVCAGHVHHALAVQKTHSYALDAFSSGDVALGELGALGQVKDGVVLWQAASKAIFKQNQPLALIKYAQNAMHLIVKEGMAWPRVEILMNHAQASGAVVRALLADSRLDRSELEDDDPLRGIVVAGTGNGTVSQALQTALAQAQEQGVHVVMASRCAWGGVRDNDVVTQSLSAVKARVELVLNLLAQTV
jgi:L-asparaginase